MRAVREAQQCSVRVSSAVPAIIANSSHFIQRHAGFMRVTFSFILFVTAPSIINIAMDNIVQLFYR